jgi:beta-lactamase regulating signal transducer with metallopeptidase domain
MTPMTDTIMHYMRHASSFAATWMTSWFLLYLLVWCAYPALRKFLLNLHPATASSAVLALLVLPFLTSLVATALVFTPILEKNVITNHYHSADCESRFPLLKSGMVIGGVLIITAVCLSLVLRKFFSQLLYSLKLESKLSILGEKRAEWCVLPHKDPLVFTMGWLTNTIFITEGLLKQCSPADIDIILGHEREHVRRKDNLRLLAGRLLMWVMPSFLVKKFWDDLQLFTEAACDFSTAEKHGSLNVAETLLRVERLTPQKFCFFRKTMVSAFHGSEVEGRVMLLLEGNTAAKAHRFRPALYLVVLISLGVLLVDPLHHGVEWLLR